MYSSCTTFLAIIYTFMSNMALSLFYCIIAKYKIKFHKVYNNNYNDKAIICIDAPVYLHSIL